jgi:hypothetical protein
MEISFSNIRKARMIVNPQNVLLIIVSELNILSFRGTATQ